MAKQETMVSISAHLFRTYGSLGAGFDSLFDFKMSVLAQEFRSTMFGLSLGISLGELNRVWAKLCNDTGVCTRQSFLEGLDVWANMKSRPVPIPGATVKERPLIPTGSSLALCSESPPAVPDALCSESPPAAVPDALSNCSFSPPAVPDADAAEELDQSESFRSSPQADSPGISQVDMGLSDFHIIPRVKPSYIFKNRSDSNMNGDGGSTSTCVLSESGTRLASPATTSQPQSDLLPPRCTVAGMESSSHILAWSPPRPASDIDVPVVSPLSPLSRSPSGSPKRSIHGGGDADYDCLLAPWSPQGSPFTAMPENLAPENPAASRQPLAQRRSPTSSALRISLATVRRAASSLDVAAPGRIQRDSSSMSLPSRDSPPLARSNILRSSSPSSSLNRRARPVSLDSLVMAHSGTNSPKKRVAARAGSLPKVVRQPPSPAQPPPPPPVQVPIRPPSPLEKAQIQMLQTLARQAKNLEEDDDFLFPHEADDFDQQVLAEADHWARRPVLGNRSPSDQLWDRPEEDERNNRILPSLSPSVRRRRRPEHLATLERAPHTPYSSYVKSPVHSSNTTTPVAASLALLLDSPSNRLLPDPVCPSQQYPPAPAPLLASLSGLRMDDHGSETTCEPVAMSGSPKRAPARAERAGPTSARGKEGPVSPSTAGLCFRGNVGIGARDAFGGLQDITVADFY